MIGAIFYYSYSKSLMTPQLIANYYLCANSILSKNESTQMLDYQYQQKGRYSYHELFLEQPHFKLLLHRINARFNSRT